MRTQRIGGYTLIELLTVVAIISILALAAPSMGSLVDSNRQHSHLFELQRLLQLARSSAISSGKTITLCGSNDGTQCDDKWSSPTVLIFEDKNNNHVLDETDAVIQRNYLENSRWYWKGSNRPYLRYRSDGSPMEWGHFTLCPANTTSRDANQIILNFVGRPYLKKLPIQNLPASEQCG